MSHHRRSWRFLLVGLVGSVLLAASSGGAVASADDAKIDAENEILRARKALDENRPADALKHLQLASDLVRDYKMTARDYVREAIYWYNRKDALPALQAADNALQKNGKTAEAYFIKGMVQSKLRKNLNEAQDNLKKALQLKADEVDPVDKEWHLMATDELWTLFQSTGRFAQAVSEFQALAKADPKHDFHYFRLGIAYEKLGNDPQAAESFLKAVELKPNSAQYHFYCTNALKHTFGLKPAIERYREVDRKYPEPGVKLWLAVLYLDDERKAEALPLLLEVKKTETLEFQNRDQLAKALYKADQFADAAFQFNRALKETSNLSEGARVNLTIELGKSLVRAEKLDMGIRKLNEAMMLHRYNFPDTQEPLDILFELGAALWKLGKKDAGRRSDEAEMYFRKYLQELEKGAQGNVRSAKDVEIAESLGDLYVQDGNPRRAAAVYQQALDIIKYAVDKEKCPTSRVEFKHIKALHDQGKAWASCIAQAEKMVSDKEMGLEVRYLLAHAYLKNGQPLPAIDQLNKLRGTPAWRDEAPLYMAQAQLAFKQPAKALEFIEEAIQKRPNDDINILVHAQALRALGQVDKARERYQKLLEPTSPPATQALAAIGMGELEMQLAKEEDTGRLQRLGSAVKYFTQASELGQTTEVTEQLNQAKRELARAEGEAQARSDRLRVALYTGGLILAALIPCAFAFYYFRRQWAMRCFQEVCALERDLIGLIRSRVQSRLGGRWERLAEEPFRGRIDFKALRSRAEKEGARDILAVANFGHLVGIIDAGWDILGLNDLCAAEMADPKEVILANLSYVGSCRTCLAHVGKLEELTGRHLASGTTAGGALKTHLSQHLHKQVKTCLQIIRAKFRITAEPRALPVLAPVTPGTV